MMTAQKGISQEKSTPSTSILLPRRASVKCSVVLSWSCQTLIAASSSPLLCEALNCYYMVAVSSARAAETALWGATMLSSWPVLKVKFFALVSDGSITPTQYWTTCSVTSFCFCLLGPHEDVVRFPSYPKPLSVFVC